MILSNQVKIMPFGFRAILTLMSYYSWGKLKANAIKKINDYLLNAYSIGFVAQL